jgi:hypothetical protein
VARVAPAGEGKLAVHLAREESELLRRLCDEMRALLAGGADGNDPVLGRLFPDAYEQPEEARAYRELVGDDLRRSKVTALEGLARDLGGGEVDAELGLDAAETWLTALNDMRLAIGTRLNVDEERMAAELDERDPQAPAMSILHWLGWLQQSLLEARAEETS